MDTNTISPKVTASALAAAITTIALWLIEYSTGVDVPTLVEGATTVLLTFAAGYLITDPARTGYTPERANQ